MSKSPEIKMEPREHQGVAYTQDGDDESNRTISEGSSTIAESSQTVALAPNSSQSGLIDAVKSDQDSKASDRNQSSQSRGMNDADQRDRLPYGFTSENWSDAFVGYGFSLLHNQLDPQQSRTMLFQLLNLWRARQAQLQQSGQAPEQSITQEFVQQSNQLSQNTTQASLQRSNLMNPRVPYTAAEGSRQKDESDDETEVDVEDNVYVKREAK